MATSTLGNTRAPRKQLFDQLDRLDVILDGLADALNESVADAVRDVVGQAVQEAVVSTLREVLGRPELLRAALAAHAPPMAAPAAAPVPQAHPGEALGRPLLRQRLGSIARRGCEQVRQVVGQAVQAVGRAWSWSLRWLRAGLGRLTAVAAVCRGAAHLAWRFRGPCAAAAIAGLVVGVGAYLAGPLVASLGCGLSGSVLAAAGVVLRPVWQLLRCPASA